jgi:hypothetical protein
MDPYTIYTFYGNPPRGKTIQKNDDGRRNAVYFGDAPDLTTFSEELTCECSVSSAASASIHSTSSETQTPTAARIPTVGEVIAARASLVDASYRAVLSRLEAVTNNHPHLLATDTSPTVSSFEDDLPTETMSITELRELKPIHCQSRIDGLAFAVGYLSCETFRYLAYSILHL